jgi:hypothetical protein
MVVAAPTQRGSGTCLCVADQSKTLKEATKDRRFFVAFLSV